MMVIIDYGMGNLRSVQKAIEYAGGKAEISSKRSVICRSHSLILPGVGAFKEAMRNLNKKNLVEPVVDHVRQGKVFLGICLGYELLFETSAEGGVSRGLGLVPGEVRRFPFKGTSTMPVPHMGWNRLSVPKPGGMFDEQCDGKYFYFVHSYYARSKDPSARFVYSQYGIQFQAGVQKGNMYGCQFHPEKSGDAGLRIIRYFLKRSRKDI